MDAIQIDNALLLIAILKAPADTRTLKPTPISPTDFNALLAVAEQEYPPWTPRLWVMLNCCLHFGEALDVLWDDFDLDKGTYCSNRNKRGKIVRAATLWPETVKALNEIKRTNSPYFFVSKWGTKFNAKGQWKTWELLRQKPNALRFNY